VVRRPRHRDLCFRRPVETHHLLTVLSRARLDVSKSIWRSPVSTPTDPSAPGYRNRVSNRTTGLARFTRPSARSADRGPTNPESAPRRARRCSGTPVGSRSGALGGLAGAWSRSSTAWQAVLGFAFPVALPWAEASVQYIAAKDRSRWNANTASALVLGLISLARAVVVMPRVAKRQGSAWDRGLGDSGRRPRPGRTPGVPGGRPAGLPELTKLNHHARYASARMPCPGRNRLAAPIPHRTIKRSYPRSAGLRTY
jgi:hypothetical protein